MTDPAISSGAVYLLDKPAGLTSRKASGRVARAWGFSKYGHAGTLDPDATGLLLVLLGKATRLSQFLSSGNKRYSFTIQLGIETDTDDLSGEIVKRREVPGITPGRLSDCLEKFTGRFQQKVPRYSAVRVNGSRAYDLARKGMNPETPVRMVHTEDWELNHMGAETISLSVTVSSGTYVRALARDIGEELGTCAAASDIRRTSVGGFGVERASGDMNCKDSLISMAEAMGGYPCLELDEEQCISVSHGGFIDDRRTGIFTLLTPEGELIAVYRGDGSSLRPVCVLVER